MAREGENQPGGRRGILSESEIIYLKVKVSYGSELDTKRSTNVLGSSTSLFTKTNHKNSVNNSISICCIMKKDDMTNNKLILQYLCQRNSAFPTMFSSG